MDGSQGLLYAEVGEGKKGFKNFPVKIFSEQEKNNFPKWDWL